MFCLSGNNSKECAISWKWMIFMILAAGISMAGCRGAPSVRTSEITPGGIPSQGQALATPPASPTLSLTPASAPVPEAEPPQDTPALLKASACGLAPIVAPTMAPDPGTNAVDPSTGLHVTGRAMAVDLAGYRLQVNGLVEHPLSLSLDELRCMPKVTAKLTLVCTGVFEDTATWSGVPLKYILDLAGLQSEAKAISMVAADRYESQVTIQDALKDGNFLAYELNGQILPGLHGFPLRAVIPSMPGSKWVKWLVEIRVE
jgi:DMSO/TMAO reductase YedYZ molybdopterin-dependent catalytic subunit